MSAAKRRLKKIKRRRWAFELLVRRQGVLLDARAKEHFGFPVDAEIFSIGDHFVQIGGEG